METIVRMIYCWMTWKKNLVFMFFRLTFTTIFFSLFHYFVIFFNWKRNVDQRRMKRELVCGKFELFDAKIIFNNLVNNWWIVENMQNNNSVSLARCKYPIDERKST